MIADIKARVLAARQFSVTVGPDSARTVQLLEPTTHDVRLASLRAGLGGLQDQAALAVLERTLLVDAITGWSGITAADLLANHPEQAAKAGDEAVAFEPGGAELLLDAQPAWSQALWAEMLERLAKRGSKREDAAKN